MSQPPTYNRSFSFTNFQASNPTSPIPGNSLDVELNSIKATLDILNANIAIIQNDDTTLKNQSVGINQLSPAAVAGFNPPKVWQAGVAYTKSPSSTVFNSSKIYTCVVSHTSGSVFANDFGFGYWQLILDLTTIPITAASQVSYTPGGGLVSTDVQAALTELGSGKAPTSHTHPSSAISDSTAAGRAMLTAASVAAQQALLGLGSLAFLNSVTVSNIAQNLTLTGVISPAALGSNTNDWSPTGLATANRVRISASTTINLTGIAAQPDGTLIILENVGSNTITLTHQDTNSAANNRFVLASGGYRLKANQAVWIQYGTTTGRWRVFGWQRDVTAPAIQAFTATGAATYTTPTDASGNLPLYLRVRMVAAGGGGGANTTNAGTNGANSVFDTTWVVNAGGGGQTGGGAQGAGGSGGSNGTGTLIRRTAGTAGEPGSFGGMGGPSALGGAGWAGTAAAANSGSGGAGGGANGAGGGGGEFVEFLVPTPGASYALTVGAKGTGGSAGGTAGNNGGDGWIEVEAFWQ